MISGVEFFQITIAVGILFSAIFGIIGSIRRSDTPDPGERTSLRFSLELSIFAVVFGILPFPLYYLGTTETFVWRVASMALAVFFAVEILRAMLKTRAVTPQWPPLLISLLALSVVFLTIEVINALWWSSLGGYALGLFWLMILIGVQFVAFVLYQRQAPSADDAPPDSSRYIGHRAAGGYGDAHRATGSMRGVGGADHPNGSSYDNAYRDTGTFHAIGRDPNRYADPNTSAANRRTVTHATVRTDPYAAVPPRRTER